MESKLILTANGGVPLSRAFYGILVRLYDEGAATTAELGYVVRRELGFKETFVLSVWRSWNELTRDLALELENSGLVRQYDGGRWELGSEFLTEVPLRVMPDIDITIHDRSTRHRLENSYLVSRKVGELKAFAATVGITEIDDLLDQARDRLSQYDSQPHYKDEPDWDLSDSSEQTQHFRIRRYRELSGIPEFYRSHAPELGWHTVADVADAWNREHPEIIISSSTSGGSIRREARKMVESGEMERRPYTLGSRKGFEYRWIDQDSCSCGWVPGKPHKDHII